MGVRRAALLDWEHSSIDSVSLALHSQGPGLSARARQSGHGGTHGIQEVEPELDVQSQPPLCRLGPA